MNKTRSCLWTVEERAYSVDVRKHLPCRDVVTELTELCKYQLSPSHRTCNYGESQRFILKAVATQLIGS